MIAPHENLAAAYRTSVQDILQYGNRVDSITDPNSPASGFGTTNRPALELLGYNIEIADPHACLVDADTRPLRLPYCFGSLVWTLAGSDDLAHLQAYHPDARNFSDDGISLSGAFGKRLFHHGEHGSQVDAITNLLKADPNSRRTFAAICNGTDNFRKTREYPCCIGIQLFLRADTLHMQTYMRAQHALLILPYDAFLFMTLQCLIAARLGVDVGTYRHFCGTFHIYEAEAAFAEELLANPIRSASIDPYEPHPEGMHELIAFEQRARAYGLQRNTNALNALAQSPADLGRGFTRQCNLVLLAHWLHRLADPNNAAASQLSEQMQAMLHRQWDRQKPRLQPAALSSVGSR